jgi:hypothetical protein
MRHINKELSRTNKTLIELLIGILTLWIKWKDKENNVYMKIIKFHLVWNNPHQRLIIYLEVVWVKEHMSLLIMFNMIL